MPIVKNEKGKTLVLDCGFDLTGQTGLDLTITRPDGTPFNRTQATGLAVGGAPLVVDGVTYPANQYITYTIQDGDFPLDGEHTRKLAVDFGASKRLITVEEVFEVLP